MIDPNKTPDASSSDEELIEWANFLLPLNSVRKLVEDFDDWEEPADEDFLFVDSINEEDELDTAVAIFEALESVKDGIQTLEMDLAFH